MTTRYFFNQDGVYIGGYDEGSMPLVPEGAVEWPTAPEHGLDRIENGVLVPYVEPVKLIDRLSSIFEQASGSVADVGLRAYFRQLQVAVSFCLSNQVNPDEEAAQYLIQTATMPGDVYTEGYTMPEPFQSLKLALLAEFD